MRIPRPRTPSASRTRRAVVQALEARTLMSVSPTGAPRPVHPPTRALAENLADAAMDDDGDSVITWFEDDGNAGHRFIRARLFATGGVPRAAPFRVDTGAWNVNGPVAAMDADGDFAVVWVADFEIPGGFDFALVGRRFDAAGNPRGPEFRIDPELQPGHPGFGGNAYDVAMGADGELIVAWHEQNNTPGSGDVYVRTYDASGQPRGPAALVQGSGGASAVAVSAGAAGDFTVAWRGTDTDDPTRPPRSEGIYARRFSAAGQPASGPITVSRSDTGRRYGPPSVTVDGTDHTTIVWRDNRGVRFRRFDAAGAPAGPELSIADEPVLAGGPVPVETAVGTGTVHVDSNALGQFLVAWTWVFGDAMTPRQTFARQYAAVGMPMSALHHFWTGKQELTSLAFDQQGDEAMAVWSSAPPVDVYFQFFGFGPLPPPPPPPPPPVVNTPPTTSGLRDVTIDTAEYYNYETDVPLHPAFADAEDLDTTLTYSVAVASTTDADLFSSVYVDSFEGEVTIVHNHRAGQATLVVTATDQGGLAVQTTFNVTVVVPPPPPVPDPPPSPPQVGNGPPGAGSVRGLLFHDLDGNRKRSKREPGMAGVPVFHDVDGDFAYDVGEPAIATAADGSFTLAGIPAGERKILVYTPEGMTYSTSPIPPVLLRNGLRGKRLKPVGLRHMGGIAGTVFRDVRDRDGTRDADDVPLRDVRLFLDANGDGVWQKGAEPATRSDKTGQYRFVGLAPGSYQVRALARRKQEVTSIFADPLVISPGVWGAARDFGLVDVRRA